MNRVIILADATVIPAGYAEDMNVIRHFSDTRTGEGRVRFLIPQGRVRLVAEGPGWSHESTHAGLHDAATFLAVLPHLTDTLYQEALDDLERRLSLEQAA